ncbi:hypothetical protein [Kineococcus sp. SYSU DK006]|uniref:hypothetical protein n=1 Tax=Kineococcus sp. SYSU DK006 TaxID=3383127 RepID=UPI003D7E9C2F
MSSTTDRHVLTARKTARGFTALLITFVMLTAAYLALGLSGTYSRGLTLLGTVLFGGFAVFTTVQMITARGGRSRPQLVIDEHGVKLADRHRLPWTQIASVEVSGMRPRWFFVFSLGFRVVTFVDTDEQGAPPRPTSVLQRYRRAIYRSDYIVMPYALDVTADDIMAAVRHFSTVPIGDAGVGQGGR